MTKGFTLIETLVAIALLSIAVVAPMSLTTQSLASAYYARDQVTAFFLAQEAIEAVRSVRDGNILRTALGTPTDIMSGIPSTNNQPFIVDAHTIPVTMTLCSALGAAACPPLQTDSTHTLYGYAPTWTDTNFVREVRAVYVSGSNEVRISVTIRWRTAAFQVRTFTLSENLYRWVFDGTGSTVTPPSGPSLTAAPADITAIQDITVTVANGASPTVRDWVGLYQVGGSGCTAILWQYLNGTQSPPASPLSSATLTFSIASPGNYYLKLYSNDACSGELATSNTVTAH